MTREELEYNRGYRYGYERGNLNGYNLRKSEEKSCKDTVNLLEELKTKTGYWFVDERPESNREIICSNCEQPVFKYHKLDFDYRPNYCPNCGAKMESE